MKIIKNLIKKIFREKISVEEAEEIFGISGLEFASIYMVYLIFEAPLTKTSVSGKQGMYLFKDEVLALENSNKPCIEIIRRNKAISKGTNE
jgi:hypothetical protein